MIQKHKAEVPGAVGFEEAGGGGGGAAFLGTFTLSFEVLGECVGLPKLE